MFGVAILGSLASLLYRSNLDITAFSSDGIVGELAHIANESVKGAVEVAKITGFTQLATGAIAAFNDSFVVALIGGIIMMIVAVIVFF